jgi:hypothetical protein
VKQLFGGLLLAVGISLMTGSGLCSIAVIVMGGAEAIKEPSLLMFPLVVGGVPFAFGFLLFKLGQGVLRRVREETRDADDAFR